MQTSLSSMNFRLFHSRRRLLRTLNNFLLNINSALNSAPSLRRLALIIHVLVIIDDLLSLRGLRLFVNILAIFDGGFGNVLSVFDNSLSDFLSVFDSSLVAFSLC